VLENIDSWTGLASSSSVPVDKYASMIWKYSLSWCKIIAQMYFLYGQSDPSFAAKELTYPTAIREPLLEGEIEPHAYLWTALLNRASRVLLKLPTPIGQSLRNVENPDGVSFDELS
jgi:hypothetical protein